MCSVLLTYLYIIGNNDFKYNKFEIIVPYFFTIYAFVCTNNEKL